MPATATTKPERRRERVARRGRRDPDHDARHEAERVLLQALIDDSSWSPRGRTYPTVENVVQDGLRDCAFCRVRPGWNPEPDIHLEGVTKRFGETTAVDDLTLVDPARRFFAMLGPSGCGKTTTLRMIGGFEDPTEGRVFLGGDDVTQHAAVQARRQHGLPVLRAVPAPDRREERRVRARAQEGRQGRGPQARRRGARARPARPPRQAQARRSSPAASSSASRSPARSSTGRARCCSTSRSARSTCACASSCRSSSSASSRTSASRSCT